MLKKEIDIQNEKINNLNKENNETKNKIGLLENNISDLEKQLKAQIIVNQKEKQLQQKLINNLEQKHQKEITELRKQIEMLMNKTNC